MARLLDISVTEAGVVETVPSPTAPPPGARTPPGGPEVGAPVSGVAAVRAPQVLDINVSEGGIVEIPSAPTVTPQPAEESGFFGGLKGIFTGEGRTTPETEAATEFIASPGVTTGGLGGDIRATAGLFFAATPEERVDVIRDNFPEAKITRDDKQNVFIELPGRPKMVLNKPGFSLQDVQGVISDIAVFASGAKLAGFGKSLIKKLAIGGGAAAATEGGRQVVTRQLGSEQPIDPVSIGLAGATGAVGEAVVPAAQAVGRSIRRGAGVTPVVKDIPGVQTPEAQLLGVTTEELPIAQRAVREADVISEQTGIRLFPGQKTGDPATLAKQRFLPSLTASSRKAAKELEAQNKEVFAEVERVLDVIAPPEVVETSAGRIRSIAEQAIEARKTIRAERAAPIYKEAFEDTRLIELPETKALIKESRENFPEDGVIDKLLTRVDKLLTRKGAIIASDAPVGLNTRKLHGAKLEIDNMLSKFGENSLGNTEKRELIKIKNQMLRELDAANPEYLRARQTFAAESPAVEELQNSIIGKISRLDDIQVERVADKLFDPKNNVATIRKARKIIEEQDPQAWRDITRSIFQRRLGRLKTEVGDVTTENIPAEVARTIFGNIEQQRVLFAGLDTETAKNFRYLQQTLKRARLGRPGGSETATREQIKKEIVREGAPIKGGVRAILERPAKSTGAVAADILTLQTEGATFDQAAATLAEVYFNPKWQPRLRELRKLDPNSARAVREFKRILRDVETAGKAGLQTGRGGITED